MATTYKRRKSTSERKAFQAEALDRATSNNSFANYPAIFEGFMARGFAESDILPRENIFTYAAWRELGRQVRKGEKGVKVVTWIPTEKKDKETGEVTRGKFCRSVTVFHVSQTDAIGAAQVVEDSNELEGEVVYPALPASECRALICV